MTTITLNKWQRICGISGKKVMKHMFGCAILLLVTANAQSQMRSKKAKTNQTVHSKSASTKTVSNETTSGSSTSVTLNTTSNYSAKANTLAGLKNYAVSDPILKTLNARANEANIRFNNSGIIGMPKRAYGFANGHILLSSTGAVTSGTQTGSGAVGTGTSLATFGSVGAPMNVNGKSSYAGINMWGNAMNMNITQLDSSARITPLKKQ
jgi:hypothetical protein